MLLPLVGTSQLIEAGLALYRNLFCRPAGFARISRCVTVFLLSPNRRCKEFTSSKSGQRTRRWPVPKLSKSCISIELVGWEVIKRCGHR